MYTHIWHVATPWYHGSHNETVDIKHRPVRGAEVMLMQPNVKFARKYFKRKQDSERGQLMRSTSVAAVVFEKLGCTALLSSRDLFV